MPQTTQTTNGQEPVKIASVSARKLPHDRFPDSTFLLLRDGYRFVSGRCEELGTDVFRTRLMGRSVVCMRGEEAARLFYDTNRIRRGGAVPARLRKTILGEGGVHSLDGEEHRVRKQMFLDVLDSGRGQELVDRFDEVWARTLEEWDSEEPLVLFDEVALALFRAVCEWGGIDVKRRELETRCRDVVWMIEGAGAVGWGHHRGRRARVRAERWMQEKVQQVRLEEPVEDERALYAFTWHRDHDGTLPEKNTVAVELLNLLVGGVAVAYLAVLSGVALDRHPEWQRRLRKGDEAEYDRFVEEVRRLYPLFPLITGKVREDFEWNGFSFQEGQKVLLDLFGTNRHPDSWGAAQKFHPDRYVDREERAFDLVPQGGGLVEHGHRSPAEGVTAGLMKVVLRRLLRSVRYEVPPQDLEVDLTCIPMRPKDAFVIEDVEPVEHTQYSFVSSR